MKKKDISIEKVKLGARLRQFRRDGHYSQTDLGMILGVDRSTYTYYESGTTVPTIFHLQRLASLYGITLDHLVDCSTADAAFSMLRDSKRPLRAVVRRKVRFPGETVADLTPAERQMLGFYRSATEGEQQEILQLLHKKRSDSKSGY